MEPLDSRETPIDGKRGIGAFLADSKGAIAIWFALAGVLIFVFVFGAIDLSRIQGTRTRLQDSLDATTLAVARLGPMADTALDKAGGDLLAAEFHDRTATLGTRKFINGANNSVVGSAEATLDPLIIDLVFKKGIKVEVESIVNRGQEAPVELALVLDTTLSMYGARLTGLKSAANTLVDKMTPVGVTSVKLAVVPFGRYVNVGVSRRNQPWMKVDADYTDPAGACYTVSTKKICDTEKYACVQYKDGVPYNTTCNRSINCKTVPITPYEVCPKPVSHVFYGCVGSPPYPKNVTDDDASRRYPGIMDIKCGSEITPLTNDAKVVKAAINTLVAKDDTYIPGGLAWGFNLLSQAVPMTEGAAYDPTGANLKPRKALVLMTDGTNTMKMNADGTHSSVTGGTVATQANTYTTQLCTNIKAKKIEVFTVAFEVTDTTTKTILKGCATDAAHYFDATDTKALNDAFKNIADALRQIYISK